jgi:hypothetical protein
VIYGSHARSIASAERSMSASVVDQFDMEIRITCLPCQSEADPADSVILHALNDARRRTISAGVPGGELRDHLIEHDAVQDSRTPR